VKAQDLIGRHDPLLRGATRHPFLDGVREGTLPEGVFERWLVQDYLFVLAGLAFQSRLVPRASPARPGSDHRRPGGLGNRA
jgi:thiaminase